MQDIKRATRRQFSAEEKIRIIPDGLRGEDLIAELCTTMKAGDVTDIFDGPELTAAMGDMATNPHHG